jgi:hypothetical protein
MHRYLQLAILGAALVVPVTMSAQDRDRVSDNRRYEDRANHDWHEWNENEERAYRRYLQEKHREYRDFGKAGRREQDNYWKWRHHHMDDDRH